MPFTIEKTVLILGAGASAPLGFPCGAGLRHGIIESCRRPRDDDHFKYREAGFVETEIAGLADTLERATYGTIDEFLRARPSFRKLGAFAIASVLKSYEDPDRFRGSSDWYDLLLELLELNKPADPPRVDAIITFNYDRSIEHYLLDKLNANFESDDHNAARRKLDALPIVHVHGQLGACSQVEYQSRTSVPQLLEIANDLRLIHDDEIIDSSAYLKAREHLAKAEQVIFLGFGFDRSNLDNLGIVTTKKQRGEKLRLAASRYQFSRWSEIFELFDKQIYGDKDTALDLMSYFRDS